MPIKRRIMAVKPAIAEYRKLQSGWFNSDKNLVSFFERLNEYEIPRILEEMKAEFPELHERLQNVSWDRRYAGIMFYLLGCPARPHDYEPFKVGTKAPAEKPVVLPRKLKLRKP